MSLMVPRQWWEAPARTGTYWTPDAVERYEYMKEGIEAARNGTGPETIVERVYQITKDFGIDLSQFPFPETLSLIMVYIRDGDKEYKPVLDITQTYILGLSMADPEAAAETMRTFDREGITYVPGTITRELVEISRGSTREDMLCEVYPKTFIHRVNASRTLELIRAEHPSTVETSEIVSESHHAAFEAYLETRDQ